MGRLAIWWTLIEGHSSTKCLFSILYVNVAGDQLPGGRDTLSAKQILSLCNSQVASHLSALCYQAIKPVDFSVTLKLSDRQLLLYLKIYHVKDGSIDALQVQASFKLCLFLLLSHSSPLILCVFFVTGLVAMAKDPLAEAGFYFDELNKLRVLEPDVSQKTSELKEECKEFVDSKH